MAHVSAFSVAQSSRPRITRHCTPQCSISRSLQPLASRWHETLPHRQVRQVPSCHISAQSIVCQAGSSSDSSKSITLSSKILTLPTLLTLARVVAIPALVGAWFAQQWSLCFILFATASLTDYLDGYLARKMNASTAFGAFLDPVADKLMVATVLVLLCTLPVPSGALAGNTWAIPVLSCMARGRGRGRGRGGGRRPQKGSGDESSSDEEYEVRPNRGQAPTMGLLPPSSSEDESEEDAAPRGQNPRAGQLPLSDSSGSDSSSSEDGVDGKKKAPRLAVPVEAPRRKKEDDLDPEQMREDLERLELIRQRREDQRLQRIKDDGYDRYAPITETNRPPMPGDHPDLVK